MNGFKYDVDNDDEISIKNIIQLNLLEYLSLVVNIEDDVD